jgi:hypothetical protein
MGASAANLTRRLGRTELALAGILLVGAALRLWLTLAWRPAFVGYPDSTTYLYAAQASSQGLIFYNAFRPAGYPLFLTWLHAIYANLTFVVVIQHLMGLLAALLLYLTVARFTVRRWVALLPAAVVAFSGAEIYLEHSALSEALYTLLLVAALWCAGRSVDSQAGRRWLWLGAAGLLIGSSSPVRSIGVVLAPVLIVWAALTVQGRRPRLTAAAVVLLGFCLGLGPYLIYQHSDTGTWGLTRTTGDTLYGRSAFFANCADFTPPPGTSALCQPPMPGENIDFYLYNPASPAVRLYGIAPPPNPPNYSWPADKKLEAFALSAISHQPLTYAWSAIEGLVKYVIPGFGTPAMIGWSHSELIVGLHDPTQEAATDHGEVASYYPGEPIVHHSIGALDAYANAARVEGPLTAILLLLMVAGFFASRGRARLLAGLFGWSTTVMIVVPVLVLYYQARYAAPAYGPLAASAAIGLDQVLERGVLHDLRARLGAGRTVVAAHELD